MPHGTCESAMNSAVARGTSAAKLAGAFRQSVGMPPHRYLLKRRIERARDLLRDPSLSLLEVALACGFSDQSHFTRLFRASMDMEFRVHGVANTYPGRHQTFRHEACDRDRTTVVYPRECIGCADFARDSRARIAAIPRKYIEILLSECERTR